MPTDGPAPNGLVIDALSIDDEALIRSIAQFSHGAAHQHSPRWMPTYDDTESELHDALRPGGAAFVAFRHGRAVGWIAAQPSDRCAWEIHPLLVDAAAQGLGIGRALVQRLERELTARGVLTLSVATSDWIGATNLFGRSLFPDPIEHLRTMQTQAEHAAHALPFWQRCGFALSGCVPDAEARGVHRYLLSKPLDTL